MLIKFVVLMSFIVISVCWCAVTSGANDKDPVITHIAAHYDVKVVVSNKNQSMQIAVDSIDAVFLKAPNHIKRVSAAYNPLDPHYGFASMPNRHNKNAYDSIDLDTGPKHFYGSYYSMSVSGSGENSIYV